MNRFSLLIFCACTGIVLGAPVAHGATLYIDPPTATLNRGDAVTVAVRIDTDEAAGECINAIDAVITYDESVIAVDVSTGKSIFPVWVEQPKIDKVNHRITFAGGIPNGYCGRVAGDPQLTNKIVELVFRSPGLQIGGGEDRKSATVAFAPETTLYLNDGLGTLAPLTTYGTELNLLDTIGTEIADPWSDDVDADTIPPEPFSITLERDEYAFEQKYYIVFNTTDKQTGISHYEVIEEPTEEVSFFRFGAATAPWREARSPYVLEDQSLGSIIRVRAIDKAGNEYVASLLPTEKPSLWWMPYALLAAAGVVLVLIAIVAVGVLRRRRSVRTTEGVILVDAGTHHDDDKGITSETD